jgi:hypothetical protein
MSEVRKPGNVIPAGVNLLHIWSLSVNEPVILENAVDLLHPPMRVNHMLKHCLRDNEIE